MSQSQSPLDNNEEVIDEIRYLLERGESYTYISQYVTTGYKLPTSPDSIRRFAKRHDLLLLDSGEEAPGVEVEGDEAKVVSPKSTNVDDVESIIRDRGLDPEEWDVERIKINDWDSPTGETLKQLTVHLKRIKPINMIVPARIPSDYQRKSVKGEAKSDKNQPSLVVFVGDQQAPYHEPVLHRLFCEWLEVNRPEKGVLIGDTMDFPDISRHPEDPEWSATTQECIDAAHVVLRQYVEASEQTAWTKLAGNHDERLRRSVIDRLRDLYGIRQAAVEGLPEPPKLLDVSHLLRLDELGIDYVLPHGGYNNAQVMLSPHLAARHGWIVRKGSGASALATLEHLGYSIVVGHTHRQSLVHKTRHDIHGDPSTLAAVETGCMCMIREGLGYAVAPDWQNGFATATVWPDGTFKLDLATFVNDSLFWRDQRYT